MIEIKLLIAFACACLFSWGGYNFNEARRDIMPSVLALACVFMIHSLWALTMLPVVAIYHLGYGDKSFFKHCFGDGWGRGIWGLLAGLSLSLGLLITGHLLWYLFIPYLLVNFTLENFLKNWPQTTGDLIIGFGFSSIILLVR